MNNNSSVHAEMAIDSHEKPVEMEIQLSLLSHSLSLSLSRSMQKEKSYQTYYLHKKQFCAVVLSSICV
jgi:hypothetical protein